MKLGDLLVRDERITHDQLRLALAAQKRAGGRLGTVLVEQGLIDFETLTVYLGLELGIPIANGATLERAKSAAVRLLHPAQALAHRCVPLVLQDRQLIAAVADPHDVANLDALATLIGYRVLPRVAPEARVFYYIERYYGARRPPRYAAFEDTPRGDDGTPAQGLPAPPLPGLPPRNDEPRPAPGPRLRLRRSRVHLVVDPTSFDDSELLELDADDLLDALDASDEANAMPAAALRSVTALPAPPVTPDQSPLAPLSGEQALRNLPAAAERGEIAQLLLRFALTRFEGAALLTVRDNLGFGWKTVGHMPGHANIEYLLVPLDAPSIFHSAVEDGLFSGQAPPSTLHSYVCRTLGCPEHVHTTVASIAIGKRPVNLLFGYGKPALSEAEKTEVLHVTRAAAEAYARLIAVTKRRNTQSNPPAAPAT